MKRTHMLVLSAALAFGLMGVSSLAAADVVQPYAADSEPSSSLPASDTYVDRHGPIAANTAVWGIGKRQSQDRFPFGGALVYDPGEDVRQRGEAQPAQGAENQPVVQTGNVRRPRDPQRLRPGRHGQ